MMVLWVKISGVVTHRLFNNPMISTCWRRPVTPEVLICFHVGCLLTSLAPPPPDALECFCLLVLQLARPFLLVLVSFFPTCFVLVLLCASKKNVFGCFGSSDLRLPLRPRV